MDLLSENHAWQNRLPSIIRLDQISFCYKAGFVGETRRIDLWEARRSQLISVVWRLVTSEVPEQLSRDLSCLISSSTSSKKQQSFLLSSVLMMSNLEEQGLLNGRTTIQRGPARLEEWASMNILKYRNDQVQILYPGRKRLLN